MRLLPSNFYLDDMFDGIISKKQDLKCDIYEENNEYIIEMDIPGFKKDDITISIDNGYLNVTAESMTSYEDRNYIRQERKYGKYQRSFYLGDLESDNVKAKFDNGILKITIPKKEIPENNKKIEIE